MKVCSAFAARYRTDRTVSTVVRRPRSSSAAASSFTPIGAPCCFRIVSQSAAMDVPFWRLPRFCWPLAGSGSLMVGRPTGGFCSDGRSRRVSSTTAATISRTRSTSSRSAVANHLMISWCVIIARDYHEQAEQSKQAQLHRSGEVPRVDASDFVRVAGTRGRDPRRGFRPRRGRCFYSGTGSGMWS